MKKGPVQIRADHGERLLFKILRISDGFIRFGLNESPRLFRAERLAEELIDGQQIDGKRIDPALRDRLDPVHIRTEFSKLVDVIPCPLISRMENVRAITMHHDAGRRIALGMAVAASVRTFIQQNDLMAFLRKMTGNNGAAETRSNDTDSHKQHSNSVPGDMRARF